MSRMIWKCSAARSAASQVRVEPLALRNVPSAPSPYKSRRAFALAHFKLAAKENLSSLAVNVLAVKSVL